MIARQMSWSLSPSLAIPSAQDRPHASCWRYCVYCQATMRLPDLERPHITHLVTLTSAHWRSLLHARSQKPLWSCLPRLALACVAGSAAPRIRSFDTESSQQWQLPMYNCYYVRSTVLFVFLEPRMCPQITGSHSSHTPPGCSASIPWLAPLTPHSTGLQTSLKGYYAITVCLRP